MSIIDDLEELGDRIADDARARFKAAAAMIEKHAVEHPQPVFHILRTIKPVLVTHGLAVVTRYPDVVEVLNQDEAFSVEPYRSKMQRLAGDFILCTDASETYERDISILRLAAPRSDLPGLVDFMEQTAAALVPEDAHEIDVADVAKRAPARLAAHWLGVGGPDEDTMIAWTQAMFEEIFVNVKDDPAIAARAEAAAPAMKAYLDQLVASRPGGATVLARLLAMQALPETALTDVQVRNNIIGVITGFIPTIGTCATLAIDALLDRPEALAGAQAAAQADDTDTVRAYIWEAMRLAPQGPGLLRRASCDFKVAEGTMHETTIPAGTLTFVATQSAMLDDDVVDDPEEFRIDRPPHHYLHFGVGMHECFGRFANALQIPIIAKAILRHPNLARAGELEKAGPFPSLLRVTM
jgi:cytochrome P450